MQHTKPNEPTSEPQTAASEPTSVAVAKFLSNGFLPGNITTDALDEVRWDHLVFSGGWEGEYTKHCSPSEVKDREAAVAAMRKNLDKIPGPVKGVEGFGGGATYADLFLAKVAARLADDYRPRTRNVKVEKASTSEGI